MNVMRDHIPVHHQEIHVGALFSGEQLLVHRIPGVDIVHHRKLAGGGRCIQGLYGRGGVGAGRLTENDAVGIGPVNQLASADLVAVACAGLQAGHGHAVAGPGYRASAEGLIETRALHFVEIGTVVRSHFHPGLGGYFRNPVYGKGGLVDDGDPGPVFDLVFRGLKGQGADKEAERCRKEPFHIVIFFSLIVRAFSLIVRVWPFSAFPFSGEALQGARNQ